MNIREISKPVTAKALNESLAKRFGKKINLEAFTLEQLEDARNKLRTTLSQFETNESFDSVNTSDTYQKNKLFLDVLNAAVKEAQVNEFNKDDEEEADKDAKKMQKKGSQATSSPAQGGKDKKVAEKKKMPMGPGPDGKKGTDDDKPAFLDQSKGDSKDKDKGDAPKGLSAKQKKLPKGLQKAIAKKNESTIKEGKEDEAELVMAAKDMVTRVTSWMEDTAEMQTESMLELADAIRDEMGQAESDSFVGVVKPALESMYTAMESTREALTQGVGQLTGEGGAPAEDMGAEPATDAPADDAEMEPTVDQEDADAAADEFAAADAATGGDEEAGREKRESKINKKKMIETSRRLGTILSKKK